MTLKEKKRKLLVKILEQYFESLHPITVKNYQELEILESLYEELKISRAPIFNVRRKLSISKARMS